MSEKSQERDDEAVASGPGPLPTPIEIIKESPDEGIHKIIHKGLKNVEVCVPIVYGTMAFWLGKKATETQSHKWTIYVRGASNEDLSVVIDRVVFHLHPSFKNPERVVECAPFELSECGWGEFQIAISIFFHTDVSDKRLTLYHHLKLYSEDEFSLPSTKKPVVVESYDEIVFSDPSEAFFARVHDHPALIVHNLPADFVLPPGHTKDGKQKKWGDTKDHSLSQWFTNFSEADELLKLAAARQQVQDYLAKLRRHMDAIEGPPKPLEPAVPLQ